jgi:hypothetical protein
LLGTAYRAGVGGELLAETHGNGILHVSASRFQNIPELFSFGIERGRKKLQHRV